MAANTLGFGDPFLDWIMSFAPSLGICIMIALITYGISTKLNHYSNRLSHVEHDTGELKTDMKVVKRRLSRIDQKLDRLISYLITTKQIDKDALG